MPRSTRFTRRSFLHGLGVAMALPWLESLPLAADEPAPAGGDGAPVRFLTLFSGNGFHGAEWWAKGEGAAMQLGKVLEPLADLRTKLVFISGLFHAEATKGNIHSSQTGNLLSGAPLASGGEVRSGTSVDQVLAQKLGRATRIPSLVVGCESSNPTIHKNYSMLYSSHISWSSPTTPTPLETYPAKAFDRLFKEGGDRGDRSVLDAVLADAKAVGREAGAEDRRKLDEYFESVRDVERRLEAVAPRVSAWTPSLAKPDQPRPAEGIPTDVGEHMRLMCDIVALGLRADTTRIATLKLNNDHSSMRFPNIGVDSMIHHLLSHTDTADWLKVNRFFLEQVAYLAKKLDAVQEGPRTLLDNTALVFCSSMLNGNHQNDRLPIVVLGGGGGRIRGGRVLDYAAQPDRQMCRLFLSLMDVMGAPQTSFGDATKPLDGFLAA